MRSCVGKSDGNIFVFVVIDDVVVGVVIDDDVDDDVGGVVGVS